MLRVIISIWLLVFVSLGITAQKPADFNTTNRETYRFYMEQKWDSLIDMGKEALRADIDYYYLRMRMGIAWYSKKNYRKATRCFKAALNHNHGDPVALEYLYFSRLYSGQYEQAKHTRKQFKGDLVLKLPPGKGRFFDKVSAEYLYHSGVQDDMFENPFEVYPPDVAGVQLTTRHYSNATLSLVNSLAPGVVLSHSYTYLSKSSHYYYNDGITAVCHPDQRVTQHQYYFSPQFTTRSGTIFMPMIHVLGVRYQAAYDTGQGFMGGPSSWVMGSLKETDFVTGLGFMKELRQVDLHLGGWYSTLNNGEQLQGKAGFTWFPLGNLNLYAGSVLNSQYEKFPEREEVIRFIPEMLLGFGISEKVWVDLKAGMGEMTNYLENNGMIVYNSYSEVIEKKIKLSLSIPVTESGSMFYLGGIWTSNRSDFYPFDPNMTEEVNSIHYNAISIYGGLLWRF